MGLGHKGNTHKAVKPVAVCEWLTRLITPRGGLVCDPFMGTGTTAISAIRLDGTRFLGIEADPVYLAMAEQRVTAALSQ